MAPTDFSRFSTPAQLYLILAGISLLSAFLKNFSVMTLLMNGIFVIIWGWILNWLCSKGLKTISWILVLFPFILFLFTFFFAKDILSNASKEGLVGGTYKPNPKPSDTTQTKNKPKRVPTGGAMAPRVPTP
jgi:energy-coupling factor transporter transmembrane protein EcfT